MPSTPTPTPTPTSTDIPGPSKLVRSVADQLPPMDDPPKNPPKLMRRNAGDGTAVEWSDSEDEDFQNILEKGKLKKEKTHKKENTSFFLREWFNFFCDFFLDLGVHKLL